MLTLSMPFLHEMHHTSAPPWPSAAAHVYNELADYERLAKAVGKLRKEENSGGGKR